VNGIDGSALKYPLRSGCHEADRENRAVNSLWQTITQSHPVLRGAFHGRLATVAIAELAGGSIFGGRLEALRGQSVLIATREQLGTALALVELDGVARRMVLCTPDLDAEQLRFVATTAQAQWCLTDQGGVAALPGLPNLLLSERPGGEAPLRRASETSEWILLTSGTTGRPKLVSHTLPSLAGALPRVAAPGGETVWSTFYDIRRYGGLQIYLRAVLSDSRIVLSCPQESVHDFFLRGSAAGVTHISGTPSHWRRVLMSGSAASLRPAYVRLSGEIADQTVLDNLRAAYPDSRIGHAFASTEAGVAFDVNDGLAGFPADYLDGTRAGIEMKVIDASLHIRSDRKARRYVGADAGALQDEDGYVDTGDLVELIAGRYHFRGRKSGVINVGGLKVHPEEVESVLNSDPRVRMSLVRARRNPITGALVVADVVLTDAARAGSEPETARIKSELLEACRAALPAYKVPSALRFVAALELTAAGKLVRPGA
jgi:acyl-coenzyme A synthetase/AMP-(fatty) acid ligase